MTSFRVALLALTSALVLSACGGGKTPPPPPPPGDSGSGDGATDGGTDGAMDSGHDGGPDTGLSDSSMGDGGTSEVFPGCTDTIFEEIALGGDVRGFQQTVAVAPAARSFGIAWSDASDGFENIRARVVGSTGGLGTNHDLTSGFVIYEGAALLSTGSTFLAAWYDNSELDAGFEVFLRSLNASGEPTGGATRLTNNMVRDDNPALVRMGTANLVAWVQDDLMDRVAKAAIVSDTGTLMGGVQTVTSTPDSPSSITLSPLAGGAGLVWANNSASGSDAILVRVDTSARLVAGSRTVISTEHNAAGGVDLATNDVTGGAAVFDVSVDGVRPEIRFREVAADGTLPAPERIVSLAPATGRDPSIAPLAGGYVVAYRALPDGTITEPTLRLTLLDVRGEVLRSFDGPTMTDQGGRTTVRVSGDGRVLVAWEDQNAADGSRTIRAARVRCAADGPTMDGGTLDSGMDAGLDSGFDATVDSGAGDPCLAIMAPPCGSGEACPGGTQCLSDGCGGQHCLPSGHSCASIDDCPAGSSCVASFIGRVCQAAAGCTDTRDCPLGFFCEAGACTDRRTPCDASGDCPRGYACSGTGFGLPFCISVYQPCSGPGGCGVGASCLDVDGDGSTECTVPSGCATNADCPVIGEVCGLAPMAVCGSYGPCRAASDCGTGMECRDVTGEGVKTCVATGGSCSTNTDCAVGQVCAVPAAGGAPQCI